MALPPDTDADLRLASPDHIDPADEKDWEVINREDLERPDYAPSQSDSKGVSASASFSVGRGEAKKKVFSFHFHAGGRCDQCEVIGGKPTDGELEDDEVTVVGEDEKPDAKGYEDEYQSRKDMLH